VTGEYVKALMGLQARTPVLISLYDQHDRLRFANAAFRSAYHVGVDEAATWAEITRRNHAADRGAVIETSDIDGWIAAALERRGSAPSRTAEAELHDGRTLFVTETVDDKGWLLSIAVDVTGMREEERKHRRDRDFAMRDSQMDELTNVPDRRHTMGRLGEFIQNCAENPQMWGCVAIIDIDYFKAINDRYGPHRADKVLLDFASQMQGFVRRTDCFGRIGGEEFMLILPDTTVSEANLILDRLLEKVRSARPLSTIPEFYYTCSVGLAEYREGDKVNDIHARANEALHLAKREGRDRVRRYTLPGSNQEFRPDQTS
jgi:diguanylate cyclase (GGDEF)-like protein